VRFRFSHRPYVPRLRVESLTGQKGQFKLLTLCPPPRCLAEINEMKSHRACILIPLAVFLTAAPYHPSLAGPPPQSVTLSYGGANQKPNFSYKLGLSNGDNVKCELIDKEIVIDTFEIKYPKGYAAFVSDLIGGFNEAAADLDFSAVSDPSTIRDFSVKYGTGSSFINYQFRGSFSGYKDFVRRSQRLRQCLLTVSRGRPKGERLWEVDD